MRPDLRRPFSVKDVGPSAAACFHGGDSSFCFRALDGGVVSRVRCRLAGRSESSRLCESRFSISCPFGARIASSEACPFIRTVIESPFNKFPFEFGIETSSCSDLRVETSAACSGLPGDALSAMVTTRDQAGRGASSSARMAFIAEI